MNKLTKLIFIILFPISIFAQHFAEIDFLNSLRGLLIFTDINSGTTALYLTTDGGDSWDSILEGKSLKSIYQFNSNKIFVGYETKGIAYTTDGGSSWNYENFGKEEANVKRIEFADENYGWVCTNRSVFLTTDGGATWSETNNGKSWNDILSIYLAGVNNGWMLKEDGQVFKFVSDSSSNQWELIGDLGGKCYGLNAGIEFFDSLNGYAVGYSRIYKTTNGGYNWTPLSEAAYQSLNGYHFFDKDSFYLCGDYGIYYSDNSGEDIDKIYNDGVEVLSIDFINSSTGWAINKDKTILKTIDGGNTWTGGTVASASAPSIISVSDRPNDNGGYVIIKFERSNLDGLINSERLLSYEIYSVEKNWLNYKTNVVPNQQLFYEIEVGTQKDSTAENKNEQSFQVVAITSSNRYESNVMSGYSFDNLPPESPLILKGAYENGEVKLLWRKSNSEDLMKYEIFRSESEMFDIDSLSVHAEIADTSFVDTSIPDNDVSVLYYKVFAVDSSGNRSENASGFPVEILTTNVKDDVKLYNFSLSQNYPNPFNPVTSIKYQVARRGMVVLKVFDVLGKEVCTLVNEQKAPGIYEVNFDASNLSSGIYFYKISIGNEFISTKKMLVLK